MKMIVTILRKTPNNVLLILINHYVKIFLISFTVNYVITPHTPKLLQKDFFFSYSIRTSGKNVNSGDKKIKK